MLLLQKVILLLGFCEFLVACYSVSNGNVNNIVNPLKLSKKHNNALIIFVYCECGTVCAEVPKYRLKYRSNTHRHTAHACVEKSGCVENDDWIKEYCRNDNCTHNIWHNIIETPKKKPAPEPAPKPNVQVTAKERVVTGQYEYNLGQTIEFLCSCDTNRTDVYLMWKVFSQNSVNDSEVLVRSIGPQTWNVYTLKLTMQDFDRYTAVQCYVYSISTNDILNSTGFIKFKLSSTSVEQKSYIIGWQSAKHTHLNESCSTGNTKVLEIKDSIPIYRADKVANISLCVVYFSSIKGRLERILNSTMENEYLISEEPTVRYNVYIYVGSIVLVVIFIIVGYCSYRRCSNPKGGTEIYSCARVQYVDLDIHGNASRRLAYKEDTPYAEIIGVLEPKR